MRSRGKGCVVDGQVHAWAHQLVERLGSHGYRPMAAVLDGGGEVAVARRADFRVGWGLTKLHTFVLVHEVDVATTEDVRSLSQQSTAFAIRNKGGLPRGLQTGVAVLPVFVCRSAEEGAVRFAEGRPPKRFAVMTLPVLVELDQQRFATYHDPRFWGAYYQDFLGGQQQLVGGELNGQVLPPGGERRATRWVLGAGVVGGVVAAIVVVVVLHLAGVI